MRGYKRQVRKCGRDGWVCIYGAGLLIAYFPSWAAALEFALTRPAF